MAALPDHELKALVFLNDLRLSSGAKNFMAYLREGLAPSEMLARIQSEDLFGKAEALKFGAARFKAEEEIENCRQKGIRLLSFKDPDYPFLLQQIYDPPIVLYFKGTFEKTDNAALAVVGTRHPSFYGISQTKKFSRELAQAGLTIVSGFAKGIDQIAHQGALEISYGRTVAVLGCGLDVDYPKGSSALFEKITERGAVVSEYPLGTPPRAENFPRRNRIISGLSLGVLVVEAHSRSGSLITAHEAAEQGREVFAIPGPVDQLTSRGTHKLIKEGAALVETPADVLEMVAAPLQSLVLIPGPSRPAIETEEEKHNEPELRRQEEYAPPLDLEEGQKQTGEGAILRVLAQRAMGYDELANECLLGSGKMATLLTRLELRGKIKKSHDGRFSLAIR